MSTSSYLLIILSNIYISISERRLPNVLCVIKFAVNLTTYIFFVVNSESFSLISLNAYAQKIFEKHQWFEQGRNDQIIYGCPCRWTVTIIGHWSESVRKTEAFSSASRWLRGGIFSFFFRSCFLDTIFNRMFYFCKCRQLIVLVVRVTFRIQSYVMVRVTIETWIQIHPMVCFEQMNRNNTMKRRRDWNTVPSTLSNCLLQFHCVCWWLSLPSIRLIFTISKMYICEWKNWLVMMIMGLLESQDLFFCSL